MGHTCTDDRTFSIDKRRMTAHFQHWLRPTSSTYALPSDLTGLLRLICNLALIRVARSDTRSVGHYGLANNNKGPRPGILLTGSSGRAKEVIVQKFGGVRGEAIASFLPGSAGPVKLGLLFRFHKKLNSSLSRTLAENRSVEPTRRLKNLPISS